jgi:hypothetical protein
VWGVCVVACVAWVGVWCVYMYTITVHTVVMSCVEAEVGLSPAVNRPATCGRRATWQELCGHCSGGNPPLWCQQCAVLLCSDCYAACHAKATQEHTRCQAEGRRNNWPPHIGGYHLTQFVAPGLVGRNFLADHEASGVQVVVKLVPVKSVTPSLREDVANW